MVALYYFLYVFFHLFLHYHHHFLFHSVYIRGPIQYFSLTLSLLNTSIGFKVKDVAPPSDRANT